MSSEPEKSQSETESPSQAEALQRELFDWEQLQPEDETGEVELPNKRTRPRTYDDAVLRYIAFHRFVTTQQYIFRFRIYAGKSPSYGFRLLKRLVAKGWIKKEKLDPEKGGASKDVLSLTDEGWLRCGLTPPTYQEKNRVANHQEYYLQFAEVMLERQSTGWKFIRRDRQHPQKGQNWLYLLIQEWGLEPFRGRPLNTEQRAVRDAIKRTSEFELNLDGLWHPRKKDLRLMLPVRRGLDYRRKIEELPIQFLRGLPPLVFELVCAHMDRLEGVKRSLRRWSDKVNLEVETSRVPHFRTRTYAENAPDSPVNRYEKHDVGDPRKLI